MNFDLNLTPCVKVNLKFIVEVNGKVEAGEKSSQSGVMQEFFDTAPNSCLHLKCEKCGASSQLKTSTFPEQLKEQRDKRQTGRKIFANHLCDQGAVSTLYKQP